MLSSDEIAIQWPNASGYFDTASYGLPPTAAWEALNSALEDWRTGRTSWEPWAEAVDHARRMVARLLHVEPEHLATGGSVSSLVGLLAASVPDGARVLTAQDDFTSLLFPWAVHADRGVEVVAVPLEELAAAIDEQVSIVAVSSVQSSSGEVADIEAIVVAAADHAARVILDVTQSLGWHPSRVDQVDAVVGAAYKWLMAPRGVAFMYLKEESWPTLTPLHAGWFAGLDPFDTFYGASLRLASTARRFDTSPAWFSWVGAIDALDLVERAGVDSIYEHNTRLANRFRAGLGMSTSDTAIVAVEIPLSGETRVRAASRNGRTRFSFHLYNTENDVDTLLDELKCA